MDELELLEAKGYEVNTKNLAIHWMCSLEWHGRMESFYGATEADAVRLAARYVTELEKNFQRQQSRMGCEGCGD